MGAGVVDAGNVQLALVTVARALATINKQTATAVPQFSGIFTGFFILLSISNTNYPLFNRRSGFEPF